MSRVSIGHCGIVARELSEAARHCWQQRARLRLGYPPEGMSRLDSADTRHAVVVAVKRHNLAELETLHQCRVISIPEGDIEINEMVERDAESTLSWEHDTAQLDEREHAAAISPFGTR